MEKKLLIFLVGFYLVSLELKAQLTYNWHQSTPVFIQDIPMTLPWSGGINSAQVSTLDLNNDGIEDLVIFDRTSEKLSTFLLTDSGYQYAPAYESSFPEGLIGWMLLRDFNCDRLKDIFTHTPFGIKVYENTTASGELPSWQLVQDPIFTKGSSGQINLQVNILDLPVIDDLDGDDDLDILVYNFAVGGGIEYHKNLSIENEGSCDLEFERITRVWGDFLECECDIFAFGDELCEDLESNARLKHIGGKTLMTFDIDNDGDKEVLIGQEDCEPIYYLENIGTSSDALMHESSLQYPNEVNPIEYFSFPAAYFEDLDGDGLKDLVSSTNSSENHENGIDFMNSLWFYKNTGSATLPEFEFVSKNYLQAQMLDLGEAAAPSFTDFDRDGDLDLFISHKGFPSSGSLIGSIWFFQNVGTASEPSFTLVDQDYLGISNLGLSYLKHQFVDMNGDGNEDLVFKGSASGLTGEISILFNQSNSVYSFDLNNTFNLPEEFLAEDQFHFTDINGDLFPDLLIGRSSGQLDYLRNIGTSSSPEFFLDTENFYGIAADFSKKNLAISVADLNNDRRKDLIAIDERGIIHWYSDFLNNIATPSESEDLNFEGLESGNQISFDFGKRVSITAAQLFNDAEPSIITGLQTGGIHILRKSNSQPKPPTSEGELIVIIYPNPTLGQNNGMVSVSSNEEGLAQIISYTGQEISPIENLRPGRITRFDTRALPNGLYLIKVESNSGRTETKQIVVIN